MEPLGCHRVCFPIVVARVIVGQGLPAPSCWWGWFYCCGIWNYKTHLGGHSRQWSSIYYASGSKGNQFPTRTLMFLKGPALYPLAGYKNWFSSLQEDFTKLDNRREMHRYVPL